jgi:TonB family protein
MELLAYLADVTARSLGLAALALLGVWLFRVKTAAARHAALTVVSGGMMLLAALTPTLPSIPLRVLRAEPAAPVSPAPDFQVEAASPLPPLADPPAARQPDRRRWLPDFGWPAVASAIYFAVALVLLLRLAYGYLFTRRLVRVSHREGDVYESAWIAVPMTVGWLRPKILLPAVWKEWEAPKLEAVLAHERTHIRRADWAIAALAAFNRSVFWFNPLAWWMERRLAFLAEQACDDAALLETGAREPYAEALLDMAAAVKTGHGRMVWEAMAMARTVEVRKRIERILDETRQIPRGLTRGRWAAVVACSLPLLYVVSVTQLAPAQAQAPVAAPQPLAALAEMAQAPAPPPLEASPAQAQEPPKPTGEPLYAGRRLVVLYFDLENLSADDLVHVRTSAQTIVGAYIADADLVAIMVNSGGVKVVQDFTGDRNQLILEIGRLRGGGAGSAGSQLASLETAMKGLGALSQKKALIYFANSAARGGSANDAQFRATIQAAQRASVAIYPVDIGALREGAFFKTEDAEVVVLASAQAPYPYRLTMAATPVQRVDPVYPAEALAAGFEGDVRFEAIVGTDGHVRDAKLLSGPSCASKNCGAEAMVAAAREAVSHYVYEPAKAPNGELAEIETMVTVPFRLRGVVTGQPPDRTAGARERLRQLLEAPYLRAADSGGDHPARLQTKVDPEYPYALRAQGYQGSVILKITVGVDGVPKDIRVLRSDPALDAAVLTAVRQWRFTPARQNGQPVESTVTVPISFQLE